MKQQRVAIILAALLAMLGGCVPYEPIAQNVAASSSSTVVLDTEGKAREFGARFANEQLRGKKFPDASGEIHSPPPLESRTWRVAERTGNRWTLECDPPAGWTFKVSVNADGTLPKLDEAYFSPE